jgi:AcrR family transcriptional regulator
METDVDLRGLAQRAGVSHAAPYHHFPDKSDLLAAAGSAYIDFALSHPGYFAVMFRRDLARPDTNPTVDEAGGDAFGHLVELISDCLGGNVDPPLRDMLVLTTWATVHGAAELLVHGPMGRKSAGLSITATEAGARMAATMAALIRDAARNHQFEDARERHWMTQCEWGLVDPEQRSG